MNCRLLCLLLLVICLTGCFKVGRLPATTASGPSYDDPNSAVVVPVGQGTQVHLVNGESVSTDFLDRVANFSLNFFLMYLEPQLYVKPGLNTLGVRSTESNTANYGYTTVTTTRWQDYVVQLRAEPAKKYFVKADLYGTAQVYPESTAKNKELAKN